MKANYTCSRDRMYLSGWFFFVFFFNIESYDGGALVI